MMIRDFFVNSVKDALKKAVNDKKLNIPEDVEINFMCEIPKNTEFGDYAVNVSMLSKYAKMAPPLIANIIKDYIAADDFEVNVINGFINFKLNEKFLIKILDEVLNKKENFAKIDLGKGKKVNIEYVSANPTGPFHIGHGRWAAIGSALAEIMKYTGYNVFQEFYINDAGAQIQRLAKSLENRVKEQKGEVVEWDDDLYKGDYLIPVAKKYISDNRGQSYADFAKEEMLNLQKDLLKKFRTDFDLFFSETSLYKDNEVDSCVKQLKESGKLYEKDGAVWFRSTDYTDSQDRVLRKSDGTNTYLTADIAYHKNKLDRGFDLLINIWGADHHGYIPRMKAAIDALGYDSNKLEVLLGQLVNIIENGEAVRMGKRKKMVTLGELVDEVGVDATRYWMLMRSIDTTLDFDVELAKTKSDQNPVFYVQYAHARCCSILRKAVEEKIDIETKEKHDPYFTAEELSKLLEEHKISRLYDNDKKADDSTKAIILKLEEFKSTIEAASRLRAPYMLCKYAQELAQEMHHFYNFTRVLSDDVEMTKVRLLIVYGVKIILKEVLNLIRVEAPEKM
ncbi:TPA: arginine--tRNA ligase [Candidatus Galligastranaerophilus gallistercoris]|nr:arginine--tRNA ligase [Candidatus Galligastranaerophilus gallistercoris]